MNMPRLLQSLPARIGLSLDTPGSAARIPSLDGLRAVAVFLVFLVHYDSLFSSFLSGPDLSRRISTFWGGAGNAGVDIFFVLSGYLIYGILLTRPGSIRRFWLRRARRLYPTFLCVFLLYVAMSFAFLSPLRTPLKQPLTLTYLLSNLVFLPGVFPIPPLIPVAWSLSYEAAFYFVAPLAIAILRLRQRDRSRRILLLSGLLIVEAALAPLGIFSHPRFLMFAVGALLWETASSGAWDSRLSLRCELASSLAFLLALIPTGIIILHQFPTGPNAWAAPWLPLIRVVLLALVTFPVALHGIRFDGWLRAFLDSAPLRALGNISYSYYLIHGAAMHIFQAALLALWPAVVLSSLVYWALLLPAVFLFTFLASSVLFLIVEKPLSFPQPARSRPPVPGLSRLDAPVRSLEPALPALAPAPVRAVPDLNLAPGCACDAGSQRRLSQE